LGKEARARLPEVTGLTHESIELALTEHFETQPSSADIEALLASTTRAPVCHVVMSANVFTAPLRALALAVATSERVFVRPSRRDPIITELLVRALGEDAAFASSAGDIQIVEMVRPASGDELHVYGSDESIAAIMADLSEGVLVRAHGTGIGIAVLGKGAQIDEAAEAISRDVGVFDQRGCLSPRFVFVEGYAWQAEQFSTKLDEALTRFSKRYPRGLVDAGLQSEISRYRATMEAIGSYWEGSSHGVGLDLAPRALILPPAARIVHVVWVNEENARKLIEPWSRYVTALGVDGESDLGRKMHEWLPQARWGLWGFMQRPPLDGPVDRRTVALRIPDRRRAQGEGLS
jgi:hypothetical protein